MKKLALLFIIAISLVSCDDTEFNDPAFQGNKDYVLWRADAFSASIDDNGFLTITGSNNVETVNLRVPTVQVGTYVLGEVNAREAQVVTVDGTVYSTNNRPADSISLYPELGFVKIDEISNNTFTGTFEFLVFDESGLNSIGYNEGIFYRVPLVSGNFPTEIVTCEDTEAAVSSTKLAYFDSFSSELAYIDRETFINACQAYGVALNRKLTFCSDADGSVASDIEALNSCAFPCDFALVNRNTAEAAFNAASIGQYVDACANYEFYLQQQKEVCGDANGAIQNAIDALTCGDADADGIPDNFEDFNGNGDLLDDDLDNDGTPNYLDNDDDGDGVLTLYEAKDEDGNPADTDGDGDVNYLDNDDDGDTILTIDENADPNMDGNPEDALDSDGDGIPDYLDAE
ncbi:hypothetical protein ESY86_14085 [Subsaximicrobium wynnwilliamsii]|uniref:Thrombospondin n=1 Tax=Subsaximicrobium wynnwilliamsii TaxID=291179 RepID=A0A5C6ZG90_9FLAO|nr:DUF6252 family protein [Subsaximicrobium wynnwilliamsii]TXD82580.1 hypothetical protein ESY87_13680 [Subsaximicrobium wynnwilliamsii]TXD88223.1 hypothetical protein ESY86_14085 [Subsaximicrobium wynnwilliamsii]TXE02238.1 hypothetical protein ESY88_13250 [Subsaximicrobium wynnwilliamsii]